MRNKVIIKGSILLNGSPSVLIDLPQGLGDQIMCFPVFASLKKAYPSIRITALTLNKGSQALLGMNRHIDDVKAIPFSFSLKGVIRFFIKDFCGLYLFFRRSKFDCVIVVHHNALRMFLYRILPAKGIIYNLENIHKSLECRNVLEALKLPVVYSYELHAGTDDAVLEKNGLKKKQYILLDLYAQHLNRDPRQWHGFDRLIDMLCAEGFTVAAAGLNPGHVKDPRIVDLVNRTNFRELLIIIENAQLVVSHDSGMFHFSYALGTPVLGLFGPIDPADRVPFGEGHAVRVLYHKLPCSPCIKNKVDIPCTNEEQFQCMKQITPEAVLCEIRKML